MKVVDVNLYKVVKAGIPCETPTPFKIETIVNVMERNEGYIYWLQPPDTSPSKQIACVQINGVFYQLNLKLEKAIFRHIRLCKGFVNLEKLEDGTPKLRIPSRLLREKMRTSIRCQVRVYVCILFFVCVRILFNIFKLVILMQKVSSTKSFNKKKTTNDVVCEHKFNYQDIIHTANKIRVSHKEDSAPHDLLANPSDVSSMMKTVYASEFPHIDIGTVFVGGLTSVKEN